MLLALVPLGKHRRRLVIYWTNATDSVRFLALVKRESYWKLDCFGPAPVCVGKNVILISNATLPTEHDNLHWAARNHATEESGGTGSFVDRQL